MPRVAALGLAAAVGGAALAISSAWRVHPREDPPRVAQQEGRGTVALGDSAPSVPEAPSSQPTSSKGLGLDMPKRPLPGQVLPPCKGVDVEIELTPGRKDTRSCWIEVKATAEKCKENGYEYRGGCYRPSYLPPRLPQSVER